MSDWPGLPDEQIEHAARERRLQNLERRAQSPVQPGESLGCCTEYCCQDDLGIDTATGEIKNLCVTDVDPIGGAGLRLRMTGWVTLKALSAGAFAAIVFYDIDGSTYLGRPRWVEGAITDQDERTIPFGNTIDVIDPDPTITVRVQNLSTVTFRISAVYSSIIVSERIGDTSCGSIKTGTGP